MDERELLLLGLLMTQSQHGYQLNEFIERSLGAVTEMKKATAYAILDRLSQDGYVTVHTEQVGNRPPRKVYSITPAGEQRFHELLRMNLAAADPMSFPGDIGLMFIDHLERDEAVALLGQRRQALEARIATYEAAPAHPFGVGVDLALEHILIHLRADRDWLDEVIARLQSA